jgi:microsomal dipeptidase-like Zn-dependent dipeptidase
MLADLHAHYPMRVVTDLSPRTTFDEMRRIRGRRGRDRLRALALRIASMLASHRNPWSGYRVTPDLLRRGNVVLAMSVLYRPGEELGRHHTEPPESRYFGKLLEDLQDVEDEVRAHDPSVIRLVHNRRELDACPPNATALVHCVEGGFHLGEGHAEVDANIKTLAQRGVVYVTVAHLFHRQVAKAAPALPFLRWDWVYNLLFPQPRDDGLSDRGEAAVRSLVRHRILIDISHMHPDSVAETVRILDEPDVDPNCEFPLIASHAGFRHGRQKYMLDRSALLEIKRRNGVVGLILAQYQLNNGIRHFHTRNFDQSFDVIRRHIDKIAEITGSHEHVALGSDFDGFIKPTMSELEDMGDLARLEQRLRQEYGADADLITHGNALRVLRTLWPEPLNAGSRA